MPIAYASATSGEGSASPTLTLSHNSGSGQNRILFVGITTFSDSTDELTGVTYGGVAMTRINSTTLGGGARIYLYYLLAPASGANNIVATVGINRYVQMSAVTYTGAKQSDVPDAQTTHTAAGVTSISRSVTTVADNCWVVAMMSNGANADMSAGASTTQRTETGANSMYDSNAAKTPAGSVTLQGTWTGADQGSICIASFAPAPVATFIPRLIIT